MSPPDTAPTTAGRARARRAGQVGLATLLSRVLGLVRDHLFAKLFGAGLISDAFVVAYRIPNLLRDLFAEGALSAAFVPTFTDTRARQGEEAARQLVNLVLTLVLVVVGASMALGLALAPWLVDRIAPGFLAREGLDQRQLTIELTRWMMPFLLLVSLAAVARGILNSRHQYFLPAVAPALFNGVAIVAGAALSAAGWSPEHAVFGWAAATVAGGVAQLGVQLPALHRLGYRWHLAWDLAHPGLVRLLRLMGPAVLGLAAVQVNIFVNTVLASQLEPGTATWLQTAFRLVYLPVGVIGVAVATVSAVSFSRLAASSDRAGFEEEVVGGLRLTAFLTLPSAVGLWLLADPIVRLLFQYGEFDARATHHTALVLACYCTGLFFFSAVKVLVPAFYALDRIRAPVIASLAGVSANLIWSVSTVGMLGAVALALGPALAALVQCAVLCFALRDRLHRAARLRLLDGLGRTLLGSAVMGSVVWGLHEAMAHATDLEKGVGARSLAVFLPIVAGAVVATLMGRLLGQREVGDLARALRR